jgi:AraC-like DNA-binding protein
VAWAVRQFLEQPELPRIRWVADQLGVSHKHFIGEFRREVGLAPKLFCRIQRFQRALVQAQSGAKLDWADIACQCGYFDQSHFVHDFQAFAGLTPSIFLERRTNDPNYVPVA